MFRISFAALFLFVATAPAAVLTIGNMSQKTVTFKLSSVGQGQELEVSLEPGEHRLFQVARTPVIAYESAGKAARFQLDPYTPYVFAPAGDGFGLQGIELAGTMPATDDIPATAPSDAVYTVKVKLFGGDGDVRSNELWEKLFRERFASVTETFEKQCRVKFEVVGSAEWTSDPAAKLPAELLKDFASKVPASADYLSVGFTSRTLLNKGQELAKTPEQLIQAGCLRGPLGRHLLLREYITRSESARLEMLIHELAHHLGAVHSQDLNTSMRVNVLDGRSDRKEVRAGLDPLNLLVVGIWVEQLRGGKVRGPSDLSEVTRQRLNVLYKTLQNVYPEDTLPTAFIAVLNKKEKAEPGEAFNLNPPQIAGNSSSGQNLKIPAKAGPERVKVPVSPEPIEALPSVGPVVPVNPSDPREQSIRQVVRSITARAKLHRQQPKDQRLRSDELTADFVQTAAVIAGQMPEQHRRSAFLIGLGIGLDDSKVLRDNPLPVVRQLCRAVESDSEFGERVAFLGTPTMRYRRDLCQHYVVSAALADILGAKEAEAVGMTKELLDSRKPSGFSFADLCADYAGVALFTKLKEQPKLLDQFQAGVRVSELLPSVADLPEGLTFKRFLAEYGTPEDPRFQKAIGDIRQRVSALSVNKK
jgi:hypothetical protein